MSIIPKSPFSFLVCCNYCFEWRGCGQIYSSNQLLKNIAILENEKKIKNLHQAPHGAFRLFLHAFIHALSVRADYSSRSVKEHK